MLRIIIGVGIVGLGLLIYSLIECLQTPRHRIRVLPKIAWIAVIVLLPIVGAGLWLGFGRVRVPKQGGQAPRRPSSPDDDPDFLRQVEIKRRQRQRAEEKRIQEDEARRKERQAQSRARDEQEKLLGDAADAAVAGDAASADVEHPAPEDDSRKNSGEDSQKNSGEDPQKKSENPNSENSNSENPEDDGESGTSQPEPRP
jgi:hypothetical protein